mgnify:CR=1 FL=1
MARFFVLCSVIVVILTTWICIANPKLSKRVVIFDSQYKIVDKDIEMKPLPIATNNVEFKEVIPTAKTLEPVVTKDVQKEITNVPMQQVQTTKYNQPTVQKNTQKTKVERVNTTPASSVKKTEQKTVTKTVQKPKQTTTVKSSPAPKTTSQKTTNTVKPQNTTPKVLTPQQETILWNKWRSDIQNKIMKEVNLPLLENGTLFKFRFDVDKNGRITSVKSWSTSPQYNPYAIQYITPVIRSLQGKSILNFPEGSTIETTTVEGNIRISNSTKYATAGDYNDVEKVNH